MAFGLPLQNIPSSLPQTYQPSIEREQLKLALAGDVSLMGQFIAQWNNLPPNLLLRSQQLASPASYPPHPQKYLPQTYGAASYLLALVPPEQIVALPESLRLQKQLFPETLTDQIPLNINRYNSEKLFLKKPDIAFISPYSDPTTIRALKNQNIALHMMHSPATLQDLHQDLQSIGHLIQSPEKAELLSIFIEAAFIALDHQYLLATTQLRTEETPLPRLLFLNYYQNFYIPSAETLTGQLLSRIHEWDISLQYIKKNHGEKKWALPIDKERLLTLNPDLIIIVGGGCNTTCFKDMKAFQYSHVYFLDEAIQHSPSQYIVLAYYDIIHTVLEAIHR